MGDALGDRMKLYEGAESDRRLMPMVPILARIDGKCFSSFTRGLAKPYDPRLHQLMVDTTAALVAETGAVCGYTQSDEISLAWYNGDPKHQPWLGGRAQKMCSILAAMATAEFNRRMLHQLPEKAGRWPLFDCRVWSVPTITEAANCFLWRERDATKNSISSACRCHYSHKQVHGKSSSEMQEMLHAKGWNWNDFPPEFKRGTYVQRQTVTRKLSADELNDLPPLHHARQNPDMEITRSVVKPLDLPPLAKVVNRTEVLMLQCEPRVENED